MSTTNNQVKDFIRSRFPLDGEVQAPPSAMRKALLALAEESAPVPDGWTIHESEGRITGLKEDFSGESFDITSMFELDLKLPISGTKVAPTIYGKFTNNGTASNSTGHGIGVIGRAFDTASGQMNLIGIEGRIDALGSDGLHVACLGISNWEGSTFTDRTIVGHQAQVSVTSDGSTPLAEGGAIAFFAPSITGGDTSNKWSFFGQDPIRTSSAIRCFSPDGTRQIVMLQADGADAYLQGTNNIRILPEASGYIIQEAGVGLVPLLGTSQSLGSDALNLRWTANINAGASTQTAGDAGVGAIRYNSGALEYSNGTTWVVLATV